MHPLPGECGELAELYRADQATRSNYQIGDPYDRGAEANKDSKRRAKLLEIIADRLAMDGEELIQAAIILQHTNMDTPSETNEIPRSQDNHLLAYFMARKARALGRDDGGWLMSAALARWLRISDIPENLGIDVRKVHGKTRLELISPEISDAERIEAGVPFEVAASLRDPGT